MPDAIPVLPDSEPVRMPELPPTLAITTRAQLRAMGDDMRARILDVIAHAPMTAKQLATRLDGTPGAIGHHLRVLEKAGLAKIVALRMTKGIVAKYYTRTARLFLFDTPDDGADGVARKAANILGVMQRDYDTALHEGHPAIAAFPRARVSLKTAARYARRVQQLIDDFVAEPTDPKGRVLALGVACFDAPDYQQTPGQPVLTPEQLGYAKKPPSRQRKKT